MIFLAQNTQIFCVGVQYPDVFTQLVKFRTSHFCCRKDYVDIELCAFLQIVTKLFH